MNDTAVYDRFEDLWKTGRRVEAEQLAREYVAARRPRIGPVLEQFSREQLVALVDCYRSHETVISHDGKRQRHPEGDCTCRTDAVITDMWLLSEYDKQHIFGKLNVDPAMIAKAMLSALERGEPLL